MKSLISIFLLFLCFNIYSQTFWNQTDGPYGTYYYSSFAIDQTGKIFAATEDLYSSTDYGDHWIKLNLPFGSVISAAFHPNGFMFISRYEGAVYRSTNSGMNWDSILRPNYLYSVRLFLINDSGYIYAATNGDGLYTSSDYGNNWALSLADKEINSLGIDSKGYLYAGLMSEGLCRSTNNGIDWSEIAFIDTSIYSIAINSSNTIFVCAENLIFKSTDYGQSWIPAYNGLTPWQNTKIFVDSDDNLYCANGLGVFRSTNNGNFWISAGNGIAGQEINSFIQSSNGYVFAATWGRAVNRTTDQGMNEVEWNASNFPSGVYFYSLRTNEYVKTNKMVLIK